MPVQDDEAVIESSSALNSDSAIALSSLIQQEAGGGPPMSRDGLTGSVEAAVLTSPNSQMLSDPNLQNQIPEVKKRKAPENRKKYNTTVSSVNEESGVRSPPNSHPSANITNPRKSTVGNRANPIAPAEGRSAYHQARYPHDRLPDPDSISLRSENSFKTAGSEPELPLVPRAVSDNYKYNSRSALERSASTVKAVQQQRYSLVLDALVGSSSPAGSSNATCMSRGASFNTHTSRTKSPSSPTTVGGEGSSKRGTTPAATRAGPSSSNRVSSTSPLPQNTSTKK